jgi:AAA domain
VAAPLPYISWKDVQPPLDDNFLIQDWFERGAFILTIGSPGAGKTNVALSQAFAIASGTQWAGKDVHKGLCVYVAAEGSRGFQRRVEAYKRRFNATDIALVIVPGAIDLWHSNGHTDALIATIKKAEVDYGLECVLVTIDTLATVMPGGDENSPSDMGEILANIGKIMAATNAAVDLVHHPPKDKNRGSRGHSSLPAKVDTEITVTMTKGGGSVHATKQRDMDLGTSLSFRYEPVVVGTNAKTKLPIHSIVTHFAAAPPAHSQVSSVDVERYLVALRDIVFLRKGLSPIDPKRYDRTEVTTALALISVDSRAWKTKLGMTVGNHRDDKEFERIALHLEKQGDVVSAKVASGSVKRFSLVP